MEISITDYSKRNEKKIINILGDYCDICDDIDIAFKMFPGSADPKVSICAEIDERDYDEIEFRLSKEVDEPVELSIVGS